jgi:hypothetical protein
LISNKDVGGGGRRGADRWDAARVVVADDDADADVGAATQSTRVAVWLAAEETQRGAAGARTSATFGRRDCERVKGGERVDGRVCNERVVVRDAALFAAAAAS